jgi:hypothetical protein
MPIYPPGYQNMPLQARQLDFNGGNMLQTEAGTQTSVKTNDFKSHVSQLSRVTDQLETS